MSYSVFIQKICALSIYTQKRHWKWVLFVIAVLIVIISIFYTNILVKKIASDEREKIRTWSKAVQQQAELVSNNEIYYRKMQLEEQKRVELLALAYRKLAESPMEEEVSLYIEVISQNKSIPVIITDVDRNIKWVGNYNIKIGTKLSGKLLKDFTKYPPVEIKYGKTDYLYYKDSQIFTELREFYDTNVQSFFSEVANNYASVPVIITDVTKTKIINSGNISRTRLNEPEFLKQTINEMSSENEPIQVEISGHGTQYIFYKDSKLLTQLRYYPVIMFLIIGIFLVVAYLLFSIARKAEQNQVWVGLAKETAHQLGTPLSSIMAWVEILKMQDVSEETIVEMQKDVDRLQTVAERFSKIGSQTTLTKMNITELIYNSIAYLKTRTSQNVRYYILTPSEVNIYAPINQQLFEWVIENLCKNAVDAMEGKGSITINITEDQHTVSLDITDTGKGIPKSKFKTIFNPGYTSKQRGWGLGLSLSERIITNYHSGKIFVKSSIIDKGTTFRIILKK